MPNDEKDDEPVSPFPEVHHEYLNLDPQESITELTAGMGDIEELIARRAQADERHLAERTERLDGKEVPNDKRAY